MIIQRMMLGSAGTDTWELLFNTEATTSGEKTVGIPFNLYEQPDIVLRIDWGDGTTSRLTSADYSFDDATSSVHIYDQPGIYTVKIQSASWRKCCILQAYHTGAYAYNLPSINNAIAPLYWYQRTLVGVDIIPKLYGSNYYNSNSAPTSLSKSNNLGYIFDRCTKLTSIASRLFSKNGHIENFHGAFEGCTSLSSIPGDIFDGVSARTLSRCFEGCFSLLSIPSQLFSDCINATSFSSCFCQCHSITEIPASLFANCPNARDFSSAFMYCTSLASLPSGLFANQTNATDFDQCFAGTSITAIPSGFFDNCRKAQIFRRVFSDCPLLADIPDYLFKNCSLATSFIGSFGGYPSSGSNPNYNGISIYFRGANNTGIQNIPSTLFSGATSAELFQNTFQGCSSLQAIPSGLFDDNAAATDFRYCFDNCSSIQTIPSGLFDNNVAAIYFPSCFMDCTSLETIPSGLFDQNALATNFNNCFSGCNISSIPTSLFDNNTAATDFANCFLNCSRLSDIPVDLFVHNTAATRFDYCFYIITANRLDGFSVRIGSSVVSNATNFAKQKSGVTRTVYVPANSTTETTFNSLASSLDLTIIGE